MFFLANLRQFWTLYNGRWLPALFERRLWLCLLNLLVLRYALVIAEIVVRFGLHTGQSVCFLCCFSAGKRQDYLRGRMRGRQDVGQMVAVETGGGQLSTSNPTQSDSNPVQPRVVAGQCQASSIGERLCRSVRHKTSAAPVPGFSSPLNNAKNLHTHEKHFHWRDPSSADGVRFP